MRFSVRATTATTADLVDHADAVVAQLLSRLRRGLRLDS
jgi:hypothetical protein